MKLKIIQTGDPVLRQTARELSAAETRSPRRILHKCLIYLKVELACIEALW